MPLTCVHTHAQQQLQSQPHHSAFTWSALHPQVEPITLRIPLPKSGFSAPNLPELNHSQLHAVRSVLQQPLSLIQVCLGPCWCVLGNAAVFVEALLACCPAYACATVCTVLDLLRMPPLAQLILNPLPPACLPASPTHTHTCLPHRVPLARARRSPVPPSCTTCAPQQAARCWCVRPATWVWTSWLRR
jgi:hypothetical protein